MGGVTDGNGQEIGVIMGEVMEGGERCDFR